MKNTQKNRSRARRRQQRFPEPEVKGMAIIGGDIADGIAGAIAHSVTIPVPRDDYDRLLYNAALVDTLRRLYRASGKCAMTDLLVNLFEGEEKEGN